MTDPEGQFAVNDAAAVGGGMFGGAFGFFSSISYQMALGCKGISEIDWGAVGSSTALGALGGAITGATFGVGGVGIQAGMGVLSGMTAGHVGGAIVGGTERFVKEGSCGCK